jgi:hydroxyacid-oxoacid transhydrogenase
LSAVGYAEADCGTLAEGAWPQQRLLQNAPIECDQSSLAAMFQGGIRYW